MTVQGPVKEQQPDGMSHRGPGPPPPPLFHDLESNVVDTECLPRDLRAKDGYKTHWFRWVG